MENLTKQDNNNEITKPQDLKLFNENYKLESDLTKFYFKVFDFIKDKMQKSEFERLKSKGLGDIEAEAYAFQIVKKNMQEDDYVKVILRVLKNKNIIFLKDNHIYFKNEQEEFILSLLTIQEYERLHLAITLKKPEEKKQILQYVLSTYEMYLKSQNSYNIEDILQKLTLAMKEKINYCSLFAFEKAFIDFLDKKLILEDFIKIVRESHYQKKSDAVRFVNWILEVLL